MRPCCCCWFSVTFCASHQFLVFGFFFSRSTSVAVLANNQTKFANKLFRKWQLSPITAFAASLYLICNADAWMLPPFVGLDETTFAAQSFFFLLHFFHKIVVALGNRVVWRWNFPCLDITPTQQCHPFQFEMAVCWWHRIRTLYAECYMSLTFVLFYFFRWVNCSNSNGE